MTTSALLKPSPLEGEEEDDDVILLPNQNDSAENPGKVRRKSFANPENIENFDKGAKNVRLEEQIKLQHLEQLMQEFSRHKPPDILVQEGSGYFPAKVQKRTAGCMNLQEFKDTIFRVLATNEYDEYLEKLFMKLDTSCDGYVDWNEFCTYLLLLYRENDYLATKREIPFLAEPKIRHIVYNRQEQTTKIVAVHGPTRYVTISKEGALTVWQPNMLLEKHYVIAEGEEEQSAQKRRFKMWVTDAVYMKNCQKVAIGSTSRDIRFYDVSSSQYFEEYHLFAMADVPYCFDYHFNPKHPNTSSLLVFGNDTGAIHLLTFLKPVTQLFSNPFKSDGGVQKIFMQVPKSVDFNTFFGFLFQIKDFFSCRSSIAFQEAIFVFSIFQGIECFDHNKNLNLLVTGSGDHVVRLWNPYVTNKAIAILPGHATGVVGVAIHEGFRQVFSYSKDAVIKVWDVKEHTCLQTIVLKFPSSLHGRMPEHGQFPLLLLQGKSNSALLVTCNDYIGALRLGKVEENTSHLQVTHDTQLCSAIYNKFLKQVVTGCDSSTIAVWDIETGNKSIVFSNAHGDEEITSMAFDTTYRRLISGARNGTVKVWNFQNGHNLHKLEPVGEAEVTGIVQLPDKKVILTVGWSQLITTYDDTDADNMYLKANNLWKGGQLHKDDILSVDFAPPNFLATAGFDGEIIVWEADTEKIYVRLRKGQPPNISKKLEALKTKVKGMDDGPTSRPTSQNSRPNSRHRSSHKVNKGQPAPVDKLLFLKARAGIRFTESAVLISSEGGFLRWWNIYSAHKDMGYFYVPNIPDESVLAMCTKPNDSLLITGDTQGVVKCWDIMDYCTKYHGHPCKTSPPVEAMWKAHDSAIVSVEYIEHDEGKFILTASTDKTARLWSPEGHYVGTFGQKEQWNIKNPLTWAHPKNPWTKDDEQNGVVAGDVIIESPSDIETPDVESPAGNALGLGEPEDSASRLASTPGLESREQSFSAPLPPDRSPSSVALAPSQQISATSPCPSDVLPQNYRLKYRSQTFAFGFHRTERSKTFLGIKVEKDLERRQKDRKGRRVQFGEVTPQSTTQFGKQCSPFHALTTPTWREVELPDDIPLSQRMLNRGYTGKNLTINDIKSMDFSYGLPETPPQTRGQTPGNARGLSTPGQPLSSRQDKGARLLLPPIKSGRSKSSSSSVRGSVGGLRKSSTVL
ncbi:WD repeat-containing protein on Y chromosome [Aplysia californica]|uniref:WD repeat-containing protein on Y chromosome n=1 Tax=Aplysia californica TaxID=6500 RepID=A0ABM1W2U6_APLCA|nr:WD repeat-containing protein on Y chromosome [Aplysia californica]